MDQGPVHAFDVLGRECLAEPLAALPLRKLKRVLVESRQEQVLSVGAQLGQSVHERLSRLHADHSKAGLLWQAELNLWRAAALLVRPYKCGAAVLVAKNRTGAHP